MQNCTCAVTLVSAKQSNLTATASFRRTAVRFTLSIEGVPTAQSHLQDPAVRFHKDKVSFPCNYDRVHLNLIPCGQIVLFRDVKNDRSHSN